MPSVCCYLLIAPIVFLGELKEVKDEEGNWMLFYYHFLNTNPAQQANYRQKLNWTVYKFLWKCWNLEVL